MISEQKQIFNKLIDERLEEITKLDEKVSPDDLIYRYKGSSADVKLDKFDNALRGWHKCSLYKKNHTKFKSDLDEMKRGNKKHRIKREKNTLYNIDMHYKATNDVIKFYDDYSSIVSEAKHEATKRTRLNN